METETLEQPNWSKTIDSWNPDAGEYKAVVEREEKRTFAWDSADGKTHERKTLDLTIEVAPSHKMFIWTLDWKEPFGEKSRLGQLKKIALSRPRENLVGSVLNIKVTGEGMKKRYEITLAGNM